MSRQPGPPAEFSGFSVAALDFYDDLENDNSKDFFTRHRQVYDEQVRAPMVALLALLEPEFGAGKVFRPYRDLRFTNDPTPYKTHQGGFVARSQANGYYVEVNAAGLRVGAGFYDASSQVIGRYRDAVAHKTTGPALQRILDRLVSDGFEIGGDRLKTRPRGYDAEHPRIELLRHRSLIAGKTYHDSPAWLSRPEAADRVRADWQTLRPLVDWVSAHVSPPTSG